MGLFEHFTRLVEATGGDEVVEEAGEVAGAQGLGEDGGIQGKTTGADFCLGGGGGGGGGGRERGREARRGGWLVSRAGGENPARGGVGGGLFRLLQGGK